MQPRTETSPQLPRLWSEGLSPEDHKWIEKYVFKLGPTTWSSGSIHYSQVTSTTRLLLQTAFSPTHFLSGCPTNCGRWGWSVPTLPVDATNSKEWDCIRGHIKVLDVDRIYNMVTETLTCTKCRANPVSWSQTVLKQLDLVHRLEFRVILTQKWVTSPVFLVLSKRVM